MKLFHSDGGCTYAPSGYKTDRECSPFSTSYYDETHRTLQPVVDSSTTLSSTCVWAAVTESHWANSAELRSPSPMSSASFQQPCQMSPFSLSLSAGTAISSVDSGQYRPNLASMPKIQLLQTQVDSRSLSLNACTLSDCNVLSPAVTDSPPTSPSSVRWSIYTLRGRLVWSLFCGWFYICL